MRNKNQLAFLFILFLPFFSFSQQKIDLLILNKAYGKALQEIDKAIKKNPDAALYLKKGMVYQNQQQYQLALDAFSAGLQHQPENAELLAQSADCYALLGNSPDAINYYTDAMKIDPGDLTLAAKLGRVHINLKDYKSAYEVFSGIYAQDSSNVYWNKQLAYCSFRTLKRKQAIALYEKVLEANPRDYGTYSNLAHAYSFRKEPGKILKLLDKGLVEFPNDPDLLLEKATFYFRTKDYETAMKYFENYYAAGGGPYYEIGMNYGISIYFSELEEKALVAFTDLYRQNPEDPIVQYYMGLCHKKMKDFPKAEEYMIWAIESSIPGYTSELYHHLGQIYGQQRKFKESLEALQKSYELNPDKAEILFEIATTYEEYHSNKTLALNYYRVYLKEVGESGKNISYALDRITKLKEDLFFDE